MTKFVVPCETFARMAYAAIPANDTNDKRQWLRSIMLENRDGKSYIVATNARILAAQQLDDTTEPNAVVNVVITPELIAQCNTEAQFDSVLTIDLQETEWFKSATASTMFGWQAQGNVAIFPDLNDPGLDARQWVSTRDDWRRLMPESVAPKQNGFLFMDTELMTNLGLAAPSKRLVFPNFVDATKPTIVRDAVDDSWLGLFISFSSSSPKTLGAASIPNWAINTHLNG